jgi:hypothetical protein
MNKNIKVVIFQAPFPTRLKKVLKYMQRMYNVMIWRVRVTIVAVKMQQCICVFSALYHKQHGFWKAFIEDIMCILIFSTTFDYNISHSKKNSE